LLPRITFRPAPAIHGTIPNPNPNIFGAIPSGHFQSPTNPDIWPAAMRAEQADATYNFPVVDPKRETTLEQFRVLHLEEFRVINQHCNTDVHYESSPLNIDKNHENYRAENTNLQSYILGDSDQLYGIHGGKPFGVHTNNYNSKWTNLSWYYKRRHN
jgi:hypothetical protein